MAILFVNFGKETLDFKWKFPKKINTSQKYSNMQAKKLKFKKMILGLSKVISYPCF
jgi:hypothetical protein